MPVRTPRSRVREGAPKAPDQGSEGLRETTPKGYVRVREVYTLVTSSTSSSGSRPGVFRSNFVIAKRKTA